MIVERVAEALDLDLDKLDTVEVRGFDGQVVGNYPATDSLWVSVPPFDPAKLPEVVIVPDWLESLGAVVPARAVRPGDAWDDECAVLVDWGLCRRPAAGV